MKDLSLEEMVGQMIVAGFDGTEASQQIKQLITDYHLGGIILFSRNIIDIDQTSMLIAQLQKFSILPLLMAIDQEGGAVVRITEGISLFPGNMALGSTRSEEYAYQSGLICGHELKGLGFNLNLAPVMDVNSNPNNPGIGVRSFGDDPNMVGRLGAAMIRGLQQAGIGACAKHFPGKGAANLDAHLKMPSIPGLPSEFKAFKTAVEAGVKVIMTSHASYPDLSTDQLPATFSRQILTHLLRHKLGFDGLVITDDLEMGAITNETGQRPVDNPSTIGQAAKRAVLAGADLVLICHRIDRQQAAFKYILEGVKRGEIEEARIRQSLKRILSFKKWVGHQSSVLRPQLSGVNLSREIASSAITLVKDELSILPLKLQPVDSLLLISPRYEALTQVEDVTGSEVLFEEIRLHHSQTQLLAIDVCPNEDQVCEAVRLARDARIIVIATYNAHLYSEQARLVNYVLASGQPTVIIAVRNPYDLNVLPQAKTYLATYSFRSASLKAVVQVIFGQLQAKGKLPVALNQF